MPVQLAALAGHIGAESVTAASDEVLVTGVTSTSGNVVPGDLYAGLPGSRTHGARYASAAADAGAVAMLTDAEGAAMAGDAGIAIPLLVVDQPRHRLGVASAYAYGSPAAGLTLIGVTGTQGKTTTTQLINAGLAAAGRRTAVIGSMGTWIDGRRVETALTTPEASDLHALFAIMREAGVDVCSVEVSSHALVLGRVDGVIFDLAVFTNFGRDHLDFHAGLDDYFAAKASLFTPERAHAALVNLDDVRVARLAREPRIPTRTFSSAGAVADWRSLNEMSTDAGSTFQVRGPTGRLLTTSVHLDGRFNIGNALAAIAAIAEIGADVETAASGIAAVRAVPGRMERVERGQGFKVIVDYAHKPDALSAALAALRPVTSGRLTVVIGAGGDRDSGKRPLMGEIAGRQADVVIVTDDNPRSEEPATIRRQVFVGATRTGTAQVADIADRRAAIRHALTAARPGDTVLIAGKGQESGQQFHDRLLAFDDREVAAEILDRLVGPQAAS